MQINTLDQFLNIDDMAVLRHPKLSDEEKRRFIVLAFEQITKEYDFNFDVETDYRIVCSELAYVVFPYPKMVWPTDKQLGRYTVSPDHVAIKATGGGDLFPVLIYHDGKKVPGRLEEVLDLLLKEDYKAVGRLLAESP